MKKILALFLMLFPFTFLIAEPQAEKNPETKKEASYWEKAKSYYNKISEKGVERASEEAKEWVKKNLEKIGDWEYKIISIKLKDLDKIEKQLNNLGKERWECYWQQKTDKGYVFFLKRTKVSYLQKVPVGHILKTFQGGE